MSHRNDSTISQNLSKISLSARQLTAIAILLITFANIAHAADADSNSADFNLMSAPSSPASALLGLDPASIHKPSSPTDFELMIQSETNSFSQLPRNIAVQIAPIWFFGGGRGISFEKYNSGAFSLSNAITSWTISVATRSNDSKAVDENVSEIGSTSWSMGTNIALLKGHLTQKADFDLELYRQSMVELNSALRSEFDSAQSNDVVYHVLEKRFQNYTINHQLDSANHCTEIMQTRAAVLRKEVRQKHSESFKSLEEQIGSIGLDREGLTLDLSAGAVTDFPDNVFKNGKITTYGFWATGGYVEGHINFLALARILGDHQNSKAASDDFGARLLFDDKKKINFSGEAVWRHLPNVSNADSWRVVAQLSYAFAKNKAITLAYGKDFDNSVSGNLVSIINLVLGFGSQRPLP